MEPNPLHQQYALRRLPSVRERLGGLAESTIYMMVQKHLLTPPVRISSKAAGWPDHEINAIVEARISGASDEDIVALVRELVAARPKTRKPTEKLGALEAA